MSKSANDNTPEAITRVIASMGLDGARYEEFPLSVRAEIYKTARSGPTDGGQIVYYGLQLPDCDEDGKPYKSVANTAAALAALGVSLRYESFAMRIELTGCDSYSVLTDDAARLIRGALEVVDYRVGKDALWEHLVITALHNQYDAARDMFDDLEAQWDQKPRLESLFAIHLKTPDDEYHRYWSMISLVMIVHRVRHASLDNQIPWKYIPVLEGPQNSRKSSFLRALGMGRWFEENLEIGAAAKEVIEQTIGKLIVEFPELAQHYRSLASHVKTFLSRGVDSARLSYDRTRTDRARKFGAFATTNDSAYLTDETGGLRFIPIACGVTGDEPVEIDALREIVPQLWGEAAAIERRLAAQGRTAFEPPLSVMREAKTLQASRYQVDTVHENIEEALSSLPQRSYAFVSSKDAMRMAGIDAESGDSRDPRNARAVTKAMKALGWTGNVTRAVDGLKVRGYERGKRGEPMSGPLAGHQVVECVSHTARHAAWKDSIMRAVA